MASPTLTLHQYQTAASETDRTRTTKPTRFLLLGLFGEAGTLLDEVKKKQRDSGSYVGYEANVVEELGDVLWYLAVIASRMKLALSAIARPPEQSISSYATADNEIRFSDLQQQAHLPFAAPTSNFEITLLRLVAAIGALANAQQQSLPEGDEWGPYLREIFHILIQTANEAGVTLENAANENLTKIFDRWPEERHFPPLFDEASDIAEEKLPRHLEVEIYERTVARGPGIEKLYVLQRCSGILIGDRVTDNIMEPDDYRFHDVFHYSYAAVLGWSPVLRALFRLKRKSTPKIDEGEDGARAILIEEGVSTFIFAYAKQLNFFEGQHEGDLSFTLLKRVREFVSGYEPKHCPLWLWEKAILDGYAAFRFLQRHRKGRLILDLNNRSLSIKAI
ncbi:nucleoside triphosphate pyrophosphohydrolase family protein [Bradyrhizobium australiense]|uniref:Nucleoside triphosphate pyrophosphohydrolase family protein n=1 Tax=Bradyrhizobium australiense TaxID=2721161 RepID=A0A7Y4LWD0_9BRAD|nr:nucleoside triphosphate pyrophosphohydrolase family protein [Bradyrhizobium australiense]NOJ40560.1 nucleoside triphosphate pyrophosphohydrolase family protein [Bradyrhizobium australiense]